MFRSVLLLAMGVCVTAFIASFCVVVAFACHASENIIHRVARLWGKIILKLGGVNVTVRGLENIRTDGPQIFMSNHQSEIDIFVCLASIPVQFRWIAKKELYSIPVFGASMKKAGYIPIDRRNRAKALESLDEAAKKVQGGSSLMTFPEGTRSRDGSIGPFKKGIFYLAIQSGVPIVPVSIIGARAIMAKYSFRIHPGQVLVIVGQPIDVRPYSIEKREELMEKVRSVIINNVTSGQTVRIEEK
ncbi:MAG: 1-acyl-sn-glycerol-3-phosphate acyltransferase [Deltaproteobacteria bacterium]|nr:1-acyl-sn-glycerol-3-phosphate acyltransferase [Deltaproteobacteria bacterium]